MVFRTRPKNIHPRRIQRHKKSLSTSEKVPDYNFDDVVAWADKEEKLFCSIDMGNASTVCCAYVDNRVQDIPYAGEFIQPTAINFNACPVVNQDGKYDLSKMQFGTEAKAKENRQSGHYLDHWKLFYSCTDKNTFQTYLRNYKHLLCVNPHSEKYNIAWDETKRTVVYVFDDGSNKLMIPLQEIEAEIIRRYVRCVLECSEQSKIDLAVLTVPVIFDPIIREKKKESVHEIKEVIDWNTYSESTAAFVDGKSAAVAQVPENVIVVDIGFGTLDITTGTREHATFAARNHQGSTEICGNEYSLRMASILWSKIDRRMVQEDGRLSDDLHDTYPASLIERIHDKAEEMKINMCKYPNNPTQKYQVKKILKQLRGHTARERVNFGRLKEISVSWQEYNDHTRALDEKLFETIDASLRREFWLQNTPSSDTDDDAPLPDHRMVGPSSQQERRNRMVLVGGPFQNLDLIRRVKQRYEESWACTIVQEANMRSCVAKGATRAAMLLNYAAVTGNENALTNKLSHNMYVEMSDGPLQKLVLIRKKGADLPFEWTEKTEKSDENNTRVEYPIFFSTESEKDARYLHQFMIETDHYSGSIRIACDAAERMTVRMDHGTESKVDFLPLSGVKALGKFFDPKNKTSYGDDDENPPDPQPLSKKRKRREISDGTSGDDSNYEEATTPDRPVRRSRMATRSSKGSKTKRPRKQRKLT